MSAEVEAGIAAPVLEVGVLLLPLVVGTLRVGSGRESCLPYEGRQKAVGVVLEQHVDVLVLCGLERSVEQCYLLQVEMLRIKFCLCVSILQG